MMDRTKSHEIFVQFSSEEDDSSSGDDMVIQNLQAPTTPRREMKPIADVRTSWRMDSEEEIDNEDLMAVLHQLNKSPSRSKLKHSDADNDDIVAVARARSDSQKRKMLSRAAGKTPSFGGESPVAAAVTPSSSTDSKVLMLSRAAGKTPSFGGESPVAAAVSAQDTDNNPESKLAMLSRVSGKASSLGSDASPGQTTGAKSSVSRKALKHSGDGVYSGSFDSPTSSPLMRRGAGVRARSGSKLASLVKRGSADPATPKHLRKSPRRGSDAPRLRKASTSSAPSEIELNSGWVYVNDRSRLRFCFVEVVQGLCRIWMVKEQENFSLEDARLNLGVAGGAEEMTWKMETSDKRELQIRGKKLGVSALHMAATQLVSLDDAGPIDVCTWARYTKGRKDPFLVRVINGQVQVLKTGHPRDVFLRGVLLEPNERPKHSAMAAEMPFSLSITAGGKTLELAGASSADMLGWMDVFKSADLEPIESDQNEAEKGAEVDLLTSRDRKELQEKLVNHLKTHVLEIVDWDNQPTPGQMMDIPPLAEGFKMYAAIQGSLEFVTVFEAILDYKRLEDETLRSIKAYDIVTTYVLEESPRKIMMSNKNRSALTTTFRSHQLSSSNQYPAGIPSDTFDKFMRDLQSTIIDIYRGFMSMASRLIGDDKPNADKLSAAARLKPKGGRRRSMSMKLSSHLPSGRRASTVTAHDVSKETLSPAKSNTGRARSGSFMSRISKVEPKKGRSKVLPEPKKRSKELPMPSKGGPEVPSTIVDPAKLEQTKRIRWTAMLRKFPTSRFTGSQFLEYLVGQLGPSGTRERALAVALDFQSSGWFISTDGIHTLFSDTNEITFEATPAGHDIVSELGGENVHKSSDESSELIEKSGTGVPVGLSLDSSEGNSFTAIAQAIKIKAAAGGMAATSRVGGAADSASEEDDEFPSIEFGSVVDESGDSDDDAKDASLDDQSTWQDTLPPALRRGRSQYIDKKTSFRRDLSHVFGVDVASEDSSVQESPGVAEKKESQAKELLATELAAKMSHLAELKDFDLYERYDLSYDSENFEPGYKLSGGGTPITMGANLHHDLPRVISRDKDWNTVYQEELSSGSSNASSMGILASFTECAVRYARVLITERMLPASRKTIRLMEWPGVEYLSRFLVQGIIFTIITDIPRADAQGWVYGGEFPDDAAASKAIGLDMTNLAILQSLMIPGLHFPLMVTVDYLGYRVLASARLPLSASTQVLGARYGGESFVCNDFDARELVRVAAERLNLRGHRIAGGNVPTHVAADMEVHRGQDGRLYVLSPGRLMPVEAPQDGDLPTKMLTQRLRSELVFDYGAASLCSNTYMHWVQGDVHSARYEQDVTATTSLLFEIAVPRAARKIQKMILQALENQPAVRKPARKGHKTARYLLEQIDVSTIMHGCGVNTRHIGAVCQHMTDGASRAHIMSIAAARALKNLLKEGMRRTMEDTTVAVEAPFFHVAADFLNLMMGSDNDSWRFWREDVASELDSHFPGFDDDIIDKVNPHVVLQKFLKLTGIRLREQTFKLLRKTGKLSHVALRMSDIMYIDPKVRNPWGGSLISLLERFSSSQKLEDPHARKAFLKDLISECRLLLSKTPRSDIVLMLLANGLTLLAQLYKGKWTKKAQSFALLALEAFRDTAKWSSRNLLAVVRANQLRCLKLVLSLGLESPDLIAEQATLREQHRDETPVKAHQFADLLLLEQPDVSISTAASWHSWYSSRVVGCGEGPSYSIEEPKLWIELGRVDHDGEESSEPIISFYISAERPLRQVPLSSFTKCVPLEEENRFLLSISDDEGASMVLEFDLEQDFVQWCDLMKEDHFIDSATKVKFLVEQAACQYSESKFLKTSARREEEKQSKAVARPQSVEPKVAGNLVFDKQKRYFKLLGSNLYWYLSEADPVPHGLFDLKLSAAVEIVKGRRSFTLIDSKGKRNIFKAATPRDALGWTLSLRNLISNK